MTRPGTSRLSAIGADTVQVLHHTRDWRLSDARWHEVGEILDLLEDALARRDPDDLADGTVELERLGPTRITRIGAPRAATGEPAPPQVQDRLVRLVHDLRSLDARSPARPPADHDARDQVSP